MMPDKASSTGTPNAVTTATNISGYRAPCILPIIPCFVGPTKNLNDRIFLTGIGLFVFIMYYLNNTTGRWSVTF